MTIKLSEGSITASKDLLNRLSILALEASRKMKQDGYKANSLRAYNLSNEIYEELEKIGYYNEV